ncbi:CRISPR system precrRNA processing endoribonuclease RAMP protein Cas6 [Azospirillum lipoferum]|uniref:CRISPR system precrRNA processing endoribonuclease RAMP protein Cas6 n=1 Tax=Azospirillum lipoferum TaxID=193 RepID=UPI001395EB49|nr:CRISPR system precrRNA processing endoribonuclease RAMP protein Cas6 [Azospirillum lipoferum]
MPDHADTAPPLDRRLMEPAATVPLEELAAGWFHQTVTLRCADAAALVDDPAFAGRLRGAFERALMAGASDESLRGAPCRWDPPCAYDVLVREHGKIASGLIVPRPMVLRAEARGRDLLVGLTLFGFACDWTLAAADALTAALRTGIAPPPRPAVEVLTVREARAAHRPGGGASPPPSAGLRLLGRSVESFDGVTVPAAASAVALEFTTPVCLRGSTDLRHGLAGFVGTLTNRVFGLARWQDAGIACDRRALLAAADAVRVEAGDLKRVDWRRGSAKQDRWLPMEGETGTVYLEGPLAPLLPLLALGALVHAGARTTFGQGAYRLRVVA